MVNSDVEKTENARNKENMNYGVMLNSTFRQNFVLDSPLSCAWCFDHIVDKYYKYVDDKSWHENCVICNSCRKLLTISCFSKDSKLFCKNCYERLKHCRRCFKEICKEELIIRVETYAYHVTCFVCEYCNCLLHRGDRFHLLQGERTRKICCKLCYDIDDIADLRLSESNSEESSTEDNAVNTDLFSFEYLNDTMPVPQHFYRQSSADYPRTGTCSTYNSMWNSCVNQKQCQLLPVMASFDPRKLKRPRTVLTREQRKKFNSWFDISEKPSRKVREKLAKETGLTPRIVQVWFQNQRAKIKKTRRRHRNGQRVENIESDDFNDDKIWSNSLSCELSPNFLDCASQNQ
ncbi:LIM/homeobox protein LMX-1.2-like [Styela clava]